MVDRLDFFPMRLNWPTWEATLMRMDSSVLDPAPLTASRAISSAMVDHRSIIFIVILHSWLE